MKLDTSRSRSALHTLLCGALLVVASLGLAGCPIAINIIPPPEEGENPPPREGEAPPPREGENPPPQEGEGEGNIQEEYDRGFRAGFARDDEYWLGYSESYRTVPDGPILYSGSEIPYVESPPYEAGYWDGVWYAYNDGYFVCYDYAFTIGFSEGYDAGFRSDWYSFLRRDRHAEYLDGSFADGYQDGFSEGRVFGAVDYLVGLPFDWLDAMWDYRSGTDLYIEEVGFGTGEYGPVYLYEYGTDPNDYTKSENDSERRQLNERIRVRRAGHRGAKATGGALRAPYVVSTSAEVASMEEQPKKSGHRVSHRAMSEEARRDLNISPTTTQRDSTLRLRLRTTWLERVNAYRADM